MAARHDVTNEAVEEENAMAEHNAEVYGPFKEDAIDESELK